MYNQDLKKGIKNISRNPFFEMVGIVFGKDWESNYLDMHSDLYSSSGCCLQKLKEYEWLASSTD